MVEHHQSELIHPVEAAAEQSSAANEEYDGLRVAKTGVRAARCAHGDNDVQH